MVNINEKKAFVFTSKKKANEMVKKFANKFGENYTQAMPNHEGDKFMVIVKMRDIHILPQSEREQLIKIKSNFFES